MEINKFFLSANRKKGEEFEYRTQELKGSFLDFSDKQKQTLFAYLLPFVSEFIKLK